MFKKTITKITTLALSFAATFIFASPVNAWGPERPTYTNASPATHVVFNSITDNAAVGDERNFVRVGDAGTDDELVDTLQIEPGKEYVVTIYYHNNAASNLNPSGKGIANGVRVISSYPTVVRKGERGMVSGIIKTTDGDPADVWDEAYFTTEADEVVLRYKVGTATIHNAGRVNGSVLSSSLFTEDGVYIGINKLDGRIPGCAEYSGYITYTLVAEQISHDLSKEVSLDGENWSGSVTAAPGDYVTYKVTFKNTGNTHFTNTIFKDTHDEGLSLRFGSTQVFDVDHVDGLTIDDILDISGYNVGDVAPEALVQIIYQAQVERDNKELCGKTLNNQIAVTYNGEEQGSSNASVTVACADEPVLPDPEPEPTCATNPELPGCQTIPQTGPVEITLAVVILLGIGGTAFYLIRTRRTLAHVEGEVSGKTFKKAKKTNASKETAETPKEVEKSEMSEKLADDQKKD